MTKNILRKIPQAPINMLEDFAAPVVQSEPSANTAAQSLEVQESGNKNNNNVYSYTHTENALGELIGY